MIKTQKERIDKGRQTFNDEIIRCSESDNIYEDILEWEFTGEVDCYSNECDYDIITIQERLIDAGRPDMAYKVSINFKGYGGSGSCICGKNNLRYVFYIQNHYCPIKKGNSIFETVELQSFMQYFAMKRT